MLAVAPPIAPSLPDLPVAADLFGEIVRDHLAGRPGDFYLRRDDNHLEREHSARYFRASEQLPAYQRCLLQHARGHTLDFGAGAGQHALALQERGVRVTAIDASPLAVAVCRQRGVVDALVMDGLALELPPASLDTVLMMGNSLGIAGTPGNLRALFQQLHELVRPGGQILADILDYSATCDPVHLRYHQHNLTRGHYPGTLSLRLEYQGHCSPSFDWLQIGLQDLRRICAESGWKVTRCVQVMAEATHVVGMERV